MLLSMNPNHPLHNTKRMARSSLPITHLAAAKGYSFANFDLPERGEVIMLAGEAGSGKTFLASSLVYHAHQMGKKTAHLDLDKANAYAVYRRFVPDETKLAGILYWSASNTPTIDTLVALIENSDSDLVIIDSFSAIDYIPTDQAFARASSGISNVSSNLSAMKNKTQNIQALYNKLQKLKNPPAIIITVNSLHVPKAYQFFSSRVWHLEPQNNQVVTLTQTKDNTRGNVDQQWELELDQTKPIILKSVR